MKISEIAECLWGLKWYSNLSLTLENEKIETEEVYSALWQKVSMQMDGREVNYYIFSQPKHHDSHVATVLHQTMKQNVLQSPVEPTGSESLILK